MLTQQMQSARFFMTSKPFPKPTKTSYKRLQVKLDYNYPTTKIQLLTQRIRNDTTII